MTRHELLELCYNAHSREEITAAWLARSAWLREHPNDGEAEALGEMLAMLDGAPAKRVIASMDLRELSPDSVAVPR